MAKKVRMIAPLEIVTRTEIQIPRNIAPRQVQELRDAATRGQREAIERWIELNLNGGHPLENVTALAEEPAQGSA